MLCLKIPEFPVSRFRIFLLLTSGILRTSEHARFVQERCSVRLAEIDLAELWSGSHNVCALIGRENLS